MWQQLRRPIDTSGPVRTIELSCQRCGSRMLSKGMGSGLHALICSDCCAPVTVSRSAVDKGRALSGLLLAAMAGFVVLLLFLTGMSRVGVDQLPADSLGSGERGSLSQD